MRIKKISPTTPANGNIENQYGTSQTNAYSEEYSNTTFASKNIENYSTTEQRIGTWIDGKPIYRKVFTGTTPTSAGKHQTIDLPSTTDSVTNFYFQTKSPSGYYINTCYAEMGTVQLSVALQVTTSNRRLYFGTLISSYSSQPYTLTVEYTKTTD